MAYREVNSDIEEERKRRIRDNFKDVVLTKEEEEEAILQGKIVKYFREKNADYWREKESKRVGKSVANV